MNSPKVPRWKKGLLWAGAILMMLSAVIYQRRTGPTYPLRGSLEVAGETLPYRLIRSEETIRDARVSIPNPDDQVSGTLYFKRYKTEDAWAPLVMSTETDADGRYEGQRRLVACLPAQPAAGKLEYYIEAQIGADGLRIPSEPDEPVSRGLKVVILVGAVVASYLLLWTSHLGGQIRHVEIRQAS